MNDLQIIRPRLAFEREFGQHRNWWVRDPRIAGNAISIYLFLLSHDENHHITQTEAQRALGLGKDAWRAAKERLLKAGFFAEIRDRYPEGYADENGPRGGQKRFRLILQDPEPDLLVPLSDAIIELDEPYESSLLSHEQTHCGLSAVQQSSTADNPQWLAKTLISPTADNPHTETSTADNPQSFIGREEGLVRLGFDNQPNQTKPTVAGVREAVDVQLRELLPMVQPPLTLAAIEREIDGRMDLSGIDVVQAVCDTVMRAKVATKPAAYVAAVLVRKPDKWLREATLQTPGSFSAPTETSLDSSPREERAAQAALCATGDHDWGPNVWAEIDRAHCLSCSVRRRTLDPVFRDLQDENDRFKFGQAVS